MITADARLSRQAEIIDGQLSESIVLVAGAGMLGSWTVLALARCVGWVGIWDFDNVEDVNSGNQAYNDEHLGKPKVDAMASLTRGLPVSPFNERFPMESSRDELLSNSGLHGLGDRKLIVVSAVDSMKARGELALWSRFHHADLFIDTRALTELCVTCFVPPHMLERYLAEELPTDEQVPDVPCGLNGTAYVGMAVAAKVASGLNRYFRRRPVPFVEVCDLGLGHTLRSEPMTDAPTE